MSNAPHRDTGPANEMPRPERSAPMRMLQRGAILGAVALAFAGAGWGLATATTSVSKIATACVTSKGVLVLSSSSGSCHKGLTKVHLPLTTTVGPRGLQGVQGIPGTPGGLNGYTHVLSVPNSFGPGGPNPTFVTCPTGTVVIGGGAQSIGTGATMVGSYPSSTTTWEVDVTNNGAGQVEVTAIANCAALG